MTDQQTPLTQSPMFAPIADSAYATLAPPHSVTRLQGFQRDIRGRVGRTVVRRLEAGTDRPHMGGAPANFAARITARQAGQRATVPGSPAYNAREESGVGLLTFRAAGFQAAREQASAYAPEPPASPPLILSQPSAPIVSLLGIAPPAPEWVEREQMQAERRLAMPAPLAPMTTPQAATDSPARSADPMRTPTVLWRRQGPTAIATVVAEHAGMPIVMSPSLMGAPARFPMATMDRTGLTPLTPPEEDLSDVVAPVRMHEGSPMDLKMNLTMSLKRPHVGPVASGMPNPMQRPADQARELELWRRGPLNPATVGRIPMLTQSGTSDPREDQPRYAVPAHALAERAPERLYPAAGGRQEQNGMLLQRSEAGSTPPSNQTGSAPASFGASTEAAANPDAGANDIQLLANEVWYLLKRRLAVEAERSGF